MKVALLYDGENDRHARMFLFPRENCLAPDYESPQKREVFHTGGTQDDRRDGCGQGWSRDRSVRYNWIASYRTAPLVIGGKTTQRHSLLVVIQFSIGPGLTQRRVLHYAYRKCYE